MTFKKEIKLTSQQKSKLKKHVDLNIDFDDENNEFHLPKYAPQIFNLINGNAGATKPKYVGQMTELVPNFIDYFFSIHNDFPDWTHWRDYYLENHKEQYDTGFNR